MSACCVWIGKRARHSLALCGISLAVEGQNVDKPGKAKVTLVSLEAEFNAG